MTAADLELAALPGRCALSAARDAAELGLDPCTAVKSGIDREVTSVAAVFCCDVGATGWTVDVDGRVVAADDGRDGGLVVNGSLTFVIMRTFSFSFWSKTCF